MDGPVGTDGTAPRPYAGVHETHIGVVFLAGDRAYKIKKPVRTDFLDFSTEEGRRDACRREIELNRRLAPDVYLGLAEITDPVGGGSEPAVVMRRMPPDRRLSTLVRAGAPVTEPLRSLARQLAVLHARARRGPEIDAEGTQHSLQARWAANIRGIAGFRGGIMDEAAAADVERLALRFLAGRAPLFDERVAAGRVLDGHGDLLADDVFCLPDGPRALDCLEFDDRLRFVDGLDDACFLAMDLERLGDPGAARRFLADYAEFAADPAPATLRHHYIAYRAFVRAKVACLRSEQGDVHAAADVVRYTDLTRRHLMRGAVRLALVGGLPGTGKSTLAASLADRFGAVLLSSDRLRKELAGLDPATPAGAGYRQALYRPEATARVYAELRDRAAALLARGESVVLDASWTSADERAAAERTALETSAELVAIRCEAPSAVAAARLRQRRPGFSDADPDIAAAMARDAGPWPEATTVPTDVPLARSRAAADAAWRTAPRTADRLPALTHTLEPR
ncbi:MAG TPA: AAA family ATPase [Pseudonocardia sp.]|nr:AAA family ATPase [Pseudonocardia sp.]